MRKIFIFFIITFLSGCGYTSVYKEQKRDIFVNVNKTTGDSEINNFIKNELKIVSSELSKNIYDLNFDTRYEKIVLAKDATGKPTDYKLNMSVQFIITSNQNKIVTFKENFKIKDNVENFEQSNYEKEIKKNFSKIVKDKLVLYIIKINDN